MTMDEAMVIADSTAGSDDWETPLAVWKDLKNVLPGTAMTNGKIWDPFYSNGRSKIYMEDLGYDVHSEPNQDFETLHEKPAGVHWLITNPPFSKLEIHLPRILKFDMHICLLLPKKVLERDWFATLLQNEQVTIVNTSVKRIWFIKDGKRFGPARFECVWVVINSELNELMSESDEDVN